MRKNLESLEKKRRSLHRQLEEVGDFKRGTISTNYRKCGKKNCICTSEGHPGHGPQYLWSTTIKGRSYAKSLKLGPELQKFMKETSSYRKHLELCDKIVKVNEEMCGLRPVSEIDDKSELDELKKKLQNLFMKKHKKK
jgi:hypothetical protein